jgi:hypothetical protein
MDFFLERFLNSPLEVIGYADDGALIFVYKDIGFAKREMQLALDSATEWAEEIGISFSIAKTKAMIFSRRKTETTLPEPLQMSGTDIEVVEEFKYLGILMDSCLDWSVHISHKILKAKKHLMMHKGLGTTWGPLSAITLALHWHPMASPVWCMGPCRYQVYSCIQT